MQFVVLVSNFMFLVITSQCMEMMASEDAENPCASF